MKAAHKKNGAHAIHAGRHFFVRPPQRPNVREQPYFSTAATAVATASRLRVFSAATQMRPVLTA